MSLTIGLIASVHAEKASDGVLGYQFIGFSTTATRPNIGFSGMNELCKADYGSGARMCTTTEAIETKRLPSSSGSGWAQPNITDFLVEGTRVYYLFDGQTKSHDISDGINGMNCLGWGFDDNNFHGTYVSLFPNTGGTLQIGLNQENCDDDFHVACCRLP